MRVPILLLAGSVAFGLLALWAGLPDLALLAAPAGLAALALLLRARFGRGKAAPFIVVDGSNVLHWQDNRPRLSSLLAVIDRLTALGYTPGVVFDANAGYQIGDRWQDDRALARLLGLPAERVLVAPKGTPADPLILASARDLGARIVSNDRFLDWAKDYPEVATPGHLVGGGFRDGHLRLDLDPA